MRCAPCAVGVIGRLVWRQQCLAVGAVAWDGPRGVILDGTSLVWRGWAALPFRCTRSAVAVVGRLVWWQGCLAVGTLARFGRGGFGHGGSSYLILFRWK